MLLEPENEQPPRPKLQSSFKERPNSVVLVAEAAGEFVGFVEAIGGGVRRNRHTAHVVIGVRQAFAG
jgi:RimJ/RimL family protein N-acetyltransferase